MKNGEGKSARFSRGTRRDFIKSPLALAAGSLVTPPLLAGLAPQAKETPAAEVAPQDPHQRSFKVQSGNARYQNELLIMGGRFECKVSARDTGGELCIYDTFREQKGGPALHVHYEQDEWFYVVKGEFLFQVGEDKFYLHPGDSAFGPRKVPHAFAKVDDGPGQMLIVWQPAGSMEDYFYQVSLMRSDIPANQEAIFKKLWKSHGQEVVGPPLKF